jgi:hypothetical protein
MPRKKNPIKQAAEKESQALKIFEVPKFATRLSLDDYFKNRGDDVHECFLFLARYAEDNDTIKALILAYAANKDKHLSNFSLDALATEANVNPNDVRRLLVATMDFMGTDEVDIDIALMKASVIRKSLEVAVGDGPDAHVTREKWIEFFGKRLVNKNSNLISVNVSSNTIQQNNVVGGLPSMADEITSIEKVVNTHNKKMITAAMETIDIVPEKEKVANE